MIAITERVETNTNSDPENRLSGPQILSPKLFEVVRPLRRGFNSRETAEYLHCSVGALRKRVFILNRRFGIETRRRETWEERIDRLLKAMEEQGITVKEKLSLGPRRLEVLQLRARGQTYTQVANSLGISIGAVCSHIGRIYETLKAHNIKDAVQKAVNMGLIKQEETIFGHHDLKKPEITPFLTNRALEILKLRIHGRTYQEVADSLKISKTKIGNYIHRHIFKPLSVQDITQAALQVVNSGQIKANELIVQVGPEKIRLLSSREEAILSYLSNPANPPGSKVIAHRLTLSSNKMVSESTIRYDLKSACKKLGVRNRTQAVLFYLVAHR